MGMAGSHESHIPMLVGYVEYILIQFKNWINNLNRINMITIIFGKK
jgi:hypothetical protein